MNPSPSDWCWMISGAIAAPAIPLFSPRPQGGGRAPTDACAVFAAIVYVLTSGCAWRLLPRSFVVDYRTAHRRFGQRTAAGLWRRIHVAVLDELGSRGEIDWSRSILDAASMRAKRGELSGLNPIDRGEPGSKLYTLSDTNGLPLLVGVIAANTHDSAMFIPLLDSILAIRSRSGPRRRRPSGLHADKGYDADHLHAECRRRDIAPRIARRGIESSERLGRWRWKIERNLPWTTGYRRLNVRYERNARRFAAFLSPAATLVCFKRLAKLTK